MKTLTLVFLLLLSSCYNNYNYWIGKTVKDIYSFYGYDFYYNNFCMHDLCEERFTYRFLEYDRGMPTPCFYNFHLENEYIIKAYKMCPYKHESYDEDIFNFNGR